MGIIVKIGDFNNAPNAINSNAYQNIDINGLIDSLEKPYLVRILGLELAELYLLDVDSFGIPVSPGFIVLNNQLFVQKGNGYIYSNGIKSILKGFIRSEWVKELQKQQDPTGLSITRKENANSLREASYSGYNEQVLQVDAIQLYCSDNMATYPLFKGQRFNTINPLW